VSFSNRQRVLFLTLPSISKDANVICTMIMHELVRLKTSGGPEAAATTLYLQADGGSENANR
jgi:hypothetical protein